ncbi:MAG: sulfatase-like hydrolase/transferase, partial [Phycisphaeraceae bacterium]|nr:sulfatase-like hydrolase/transferase [Phycisphaeraceae bacterium]
MPTRNLLLIIADDWSPYAGCYGDDWIQTPHIDRFAESATRFNRGFCSSPSCAVSRASILTGQHVHTHGQYGHCHGREGFSTHKDVRSLPAHLREAG